MIKFKKIGIFLLGTILSIGINFLYNPCSALGDGNPKDIGIKKDSTTTIDGIPTESIDQGSHSMSEKIKGILHLPEPENYDTGLGYVITLIQITINRLLGMLAIVALVYMLYCGFLILTSGADDSNASKGKKGIRTAAIALAGVGLSRLIVSAIIRFIKIMAE